MTALLAVVAIYVFHLCVYRPLTRRRRQWRALRDRNDRRVIDAASASRLARRRSWR